MTKAQLIAEIQAVHDTISNDGSLTSAQARVKLGIDLGSAIDTFVNDKIPSDQSGRINALKDLVSLLVKELMKQRIDVGRNLDMLQLTTIIDGLDNM